VVTDEQSGKLLNAGREVVIVDQSGKLLNAGVEVVVKNKVASYSTLGGR